MRRNCRVWQRSTAVVERSVDDGRSQGSMRVRAYRVRKRAIYPDISGWRKSVAGRKYHTLTIYTVREFSGFGSTVRVLVRYEQPKFRLDEKHRTAASRIPYTSVARRPSTVGHSQASRGRDYSTVLVLVRTACASPGVEQRYGNVSPSSAAPNPFISSPAAPLHCPNHQADVNLQHRMICD